MNQNDLVTVPLHVNENHQKRVQFFAGIAKQLGLNLYGISRTMGPTPVILMPRAVFKAAMETQKPPQPPVASEPVAAAPAREPEQAPKPRKRATRKKA